MKYKFAFRSCCVPSNNVSLHGVLPATKPLHSDFFKPKKGYRKRFLIHTFTQVDRISWVRTASFQSLLLLVGSWSLQLETGWIKQCTFIPSSFHWHKKRPSFLEVEKAYLCRRSGWQLIYVEVTLRWARTAIWYKRRLLTWVANRKLTVFVAVLRKDAWELLSSCRENASFVTSQIQGKTYEFF